MTREEQREAFLQRIRAGIAEACVAAQDLAAHCDTETPGEYEVWQRAHDIASSLRMGRIGEYGGDLRNLIRSLDSAAERQAQEVTS